MREYIKNSIRRFLDYEPTASQVITITPTILTEGTRHILGPEDMLILSTDQILGERLLIKLRESLTELLEKSGFSPKILILQGGLKIATMTKNTGDTLDNTIENKRV